MSSATRVTNEEFGERVRCDFTMASRLRTGDRLPSRDLLRRIVAAYDLDGDEALRESETPERFSAYLRKHVFEPEDTS